MRRLSTVFILFLVAWLWAATSQARPVVYLIQTPGTHTLAEFELKMLADMASQVQLFRHLYRYDVRMLSLEDATPDKIQSALSERNVAAVFYIGEARKSGWLMSGSSMDLDQLDIFKKSTARLFFFAGANSDQTIQRYEFPEGSIVHHELQFQQPLRNYVSSGLLEKHLKTLQNTVLKNSCLWLF